MRAGDKLDIMMRTVCKNTKIQNTYTEFASAAVTGRPPKADNSRQKSRHAITTTLLHFGA